MKRPARCDETRCWLRQGARGSSALNPATAMSHPAHPPSLPLLSGQRSPALAAAQPYLRSTAGIPGPFHASSPSPPLPTQGASSTPRCPAPTPPPHLLVHCAWAAQAAQFWFRSWQVVLVAAGDGDGDGVWEGEGEEDGVGDEAPVEFPELRLNSWQMPQLTRHMACMYMGLRRRQRHGG